MRVQKKAKNAQNGIGYRKALYAKVYEEQGLGTGDWGLGKAKATPGPGTGDWERQTAGNQAKGYGERQDG
jgi:hypothetical protein